MIVAMECLQDGDGYYNKRDEETDKEQTVGEWQIRHVDEQKCEDFFNTRSGYPVSSGYFSKLTWYI
ncbi:MAG TPA: hypothetical protein DEP80_02610 [Anaerolineae bacterium]|nr:hypothetical protein [Anaerolineae bacterium]